MVSGIRTTIRWKLCTKLPWRYVKLFPSKLNYDPKLEFRCLILFFYIFQLNENGRHFPILGVCLGYEFLITVANNDKNILKNCSVFHESLPIRFTDSYIKSTLFFRLNSDQAHTLQYRNSTYNWHM